MVHAKVRQALHFGEIDDGGSVDSDIETRYVIKRHDILSHVSLITTL